MSLTSGRREERLYAQYNLDDVISDRAYNLIMGGVVFYGLLVNALMCYYFGDMTRYFNPVVLLIGYFVCCISGIILSSRSKNPLISFLGYNLVVVPVGIVISCLIEEYGGIGSMAVFYAFLYTMTITGIMICASIIYPNFFARLGMMLFSCLIGLIVMELIAILLGLPQTLFIWFGAILFALYIGYDFYRSQQYTKTVDNAVDCALDIYLDIINLFIRILQIMGNSKSRRRSYG